MAGRLSAAMCLRQQAHTRACISATIAPIETGHLAPVS